MNILMESEGIIFGRITEKITNYEDLEIDVSKMEDAKTKITVGGNLSTRAHAGDRSYPDTLQ